MKANRYRDVYAQARLQILIVKINNTVVRME